MKQLSYQKRPALKNESPLTLYEQIRPVRRSFNEAGGQYSFLLQSGQTKQFPAQLLSCSVAQCSRWSFLGWQPKKMFVIPSNNNQNPDQILKKLQTELISYQTKPRPDFPPFYGGLVGFFSYDFGTKFENIKQKVRDDLDCPEVYFGLYEKVICFDHQKNEIWFFGGAQNDIDNNVDVETLQCKVSTKVSSISSNLTLAEYRQKIAKIKHCLKIGHTYQVNFSQRFQTQTTLDPFEIYKKITQINPSPFQAYFESPDFAVISNSPERLVRVYHDFKNNQNIIETKPIKGTIPRGKTPSQDEKNKQTLLSSEKDKAELVMIVDLARNDIGKICQLGSVEVNESRIINGYSHVWHTMSNVRGILQPDKNFTDVIKAVFPGGSITGCPKTRTMEIIDELEDYKRGVYCGSLGYIGFDGQMDFNIMIRTMFYKKTNAQLLSCSAAQLSFHSGGGIVIDSKADDEYKETLAKAEAIIKSLENIKSFPLGAKNHISRKDIYDYL